MPHQWNNIWVVSQAEILPFYNNSPANIKQAIVRNRDNDFGIKKVRVGGNGREALYKYDSLPVEIKNALGDPTKVEHILERYYKVDTDAVDFYTKYKIQGVNLASKFQEEYITNASVLRAAILLKSTREQERKSKGISCKGVMSSICNDVISFNPILQKRYHVKHTLASSEKRFKETFNDFVKPFENYQYDYSALISGKVRNQNSRKVDDQVMQLLNDLFAGQSTKPTRTEVSRVYDGFLAGYVEVVSEETGELYEPKDFKPLSDKTIIKYLGMWKERIGTQVIRNQERGYQLGQFITPFSFKKPEFAGSIISVDDRQPPFQYAKGERVWFYNGIDLGSEAFVCWVYGKSKSGIILEFYRQLIRNFTEWGFCLPWELEAEASLNSSYTKTFLREGSVFQKVNIYANSARSKRIERYYKDLRYVYEKEREGWLARPFCLNEANRPRNEKQNEIITPYSTIINNSLKDIEDWNNAPHSKHSDKSRWDVFVEKQHPQLKPTNWRAILPALGYMTKSSVRVGEISLQDGKYLLGDDGEIYTGERLINLFSILQDQDVNVYWLDDNQGKVMKALVYLNDTCICEALPKPMPQKASLERTPADEQAEAILGAYRATITAYMSQKRSSINPVLVIDNRPKTIGRSFVMPGISRYEVNEDDPRLPEVLPDPDEDEITEEITTSNNSFVKSTKDRI